MLAVGIDIGSVAAKAVIMSRENGAILGHAIMPTGWNHKEAAASVVAAATAKAGVSKGDLSAIAGTGYGRVAMKGKVKTVSEITCHAKGAAHFFPNASGVVDIGGQDSKAVKLGPHGTVIDFVMNDKCAAGTGRFMQMVATLLEMDLEAFCKAAVFGKPIRINSMCAVFAESEIIGLLAQGTKPEDIAAGVSKSVAGRTAGLAKRLGLQGSVVFTGGLAGCPAIAGHLSEALDAEVLAPELAQLTGAVGAALLA